MPAPLPLDKAVLVYQNRDNVDLRAYFVLDTFRLKYPNWNLICEDDQASLVAHYVVVHVVLK